MLKHLKALAAGAAAATTVFAFIGGLVSFFGGHVPPWPTYAWAQTVQQSTDQNALAIQQLRTLMLSNKVGELQAYVAANPKDVRARQELEFWTAQLQQAEAASLPRRK